MVLSEINFLFCSHKRKFHFQINLAKFTREVVQELKEKSHRDQLL